MSFRRRMVAAVTAITVVTLGAAFSTIWVAVNRSQQRQLDDALRAVAEDEARDAEALGAGPLAISNRPGPAANDVGPLPKYGAIYDAGGRVLAATPIFRGAPPPLASIDAHGGRCFDLWYGDEHLRGVTMPIQGRAATLLLATPRTDIDGDEAFLARAMLIVFVVAVGWIGVVTTWIVRRLTREHDAIALAARRVTAGDLSARVATRARDPELAQLGRDVDDMIERLDTLVTSQQRFIAEAAHELRSPLTTLYGELAHALRKERSAEEYRRAIEGALDGARRLKLMTEDLLALARAGTTAGEPDERFHLLPRVRAAVDVVGAEARERGIRVEVDGPDAAVSGRPRDVERMLRNVVENAVRHSPRGGAVAVRTTIHAEALEVAVTDEGPGVLEPDRARIFEPFYRGAHERAGDAAGAGLGLAIAREIARAHGGDVLLGDARDTKAGALFVIRLPLGDAPRPAGGP